MAVFTIKQGDTLPDPQATLYDADDVAINLTSASSVAFHMKNKNSGELKVNAAATIVTAASGVVKYQWAAADTATAGTYLVEWEITWNNGDKQTVPNDGSDELAIPSQLA